MFVYTASLSPWRRLEHSVKISAKLFKLKLVTDNFLFHLCSSQTQKPLKVLKENHNTVLTLSLAWSRALISGFMHGSALCIACICAYMWYVCAIPTYRGSVLNLSSTRAYTYMLQVNALLPVSIFIKSKN